MVAKNQPDQIDPWVQRYVNKLKSMTGLSNWNIIVSPKPADPGSLGETEVVYGQNLAKMYLHKDFRKDSPEEIRDTIVHELMHCHMEPMIEIMSDVLKPEADDPKSKAVHKAAMAVLAYESERIVDAISESLGKWLPTPDMPKPRKTSKTRAKKKARR